jgi:hypothetical protein
MQVTIPRMAGKGNLAVPYCNRFLAETYQYVAPCLGGRRRRIILAGASPATTFWAADDA